MQKIRNVLWLLSKTIFKKKQILSFFQNISCATFLILWQQTSWRIFEKTTIYLIIHQCPSYMGVPNFIWVCEFPSYDFYFLSVLGAWNKVKNSIFQLLCTLAIWAPQLFVKSQSCNNYPITPLKGAAPLSEIFYDFLENKIP